MKVQVTIEQDYCPCEYADHEPACCSDLFNYEADVPDSLIGPISEPILVDGDQYAWRPWANIQPAHKREQLLEDLWLEAERVLERKLSKRYPIVLVDPSIPRRA